MTVGLESAIPNAKPNRRWFHEVLLPIRGETTITTFWVAMAGTV